MTRSEFLSTLIARNGAESPLPQGYADLFTLGELFNMTQAAETNAREQDAGERNAYVINGEVTFPASFVSAHDTNEIEIPF
jgi:hypothetical protein